MNDEFLKYYNQELTFIRHMGGEFAKQHPKIAGRLRLSDEQIEDPHVSRLIESFAFLTAQIRRRLDDGFPELTDALLGQLYPDYQAPIPSMSILKIASQNISSGGTSIPKGSLVTAETEDASVCSFKTCYDTPLWPIEVSAAKFQNAPFSAPRPKWNKTALSVLKISMQGEFDESAIAEMGIKKLRFYLNGQAQHVLPMYEMLFKHAVGLAITPNNNTQVVEYFGPRHIHQVGFSEEHKVIPYSDRTLAGYRLLVENFLFPEKFQFFELDELNPAWPNVEDKFDLYIYFDKESTELAKQISKSHFQIGTSPIINLFEQRLEPVRVDHGQHEYLLSAQYHNPEKSEVISIDTVTACNDHDEMITLSPFYSQAHPRYAGISDMHWNCRREASHVIGGKSEAGSKMYISMVQHDFSNFSDDNNDWLLNITAQCSNRNLASRLSFGANSPNFSVQDYASVIERAHCLCAPTHSIRPDLSDASRWQLISHLNLNHFSGENSSDKLKEVLKLYDFRATPESRTLINSICNVTLTPASSRVNVRGHISFCQGTDILLEFSADDFSGSGIFFFSSILDHFFAQFTALNSFTRLSIKLKNQEQLYHSWPARSGLKALV